jgi:hypothetical protein
MLRQLTRILTAALLALVTASVGTGPGPAMEAGTEARQALAIIVNPKNSVTNLSFNELRAYFKLEQQFWPDKQRIEVFLRPSSSTEMQILLDEVYKMTSAKLRKYWVGRVFRGEIPSKPSVVPTAKSARTRVLKVPTALTVVMLDEVPEGVRVITIDGKKPGDEGYRLNLETGEDTSNP